MYAHVGAFLERHKSQFATLEPTTKRLRTHTNGYFAKQVKSVYGDELFSFAAVPIENMMAQLFADIEDLIREQQ